MAGFNNNLSKYMMWHYGLFGFGWILMVIFWTAVIMLIIRVIFRSVGAGSRGQMWSYHHHSALDILDERYAKGEIDQKEYEERRKILSQQ